MQVSLNWVQYKLYVKSLFHDGGSIDRKTLSSTNESVIATHEDCSVILNQNAALDTTQIYFLNRGIFILGDTAFSKLLKAKSKLCHLIN